MHAMLCFMCRGTNYYCCCCPGLAGTEFTDVRGASENSFVSVDTFVPLTHLGPLVKSVWTLVVLTFPDSSLRFCCLIKYGPVLNNSCLFHPIRPQGYIVVNILTISLLKLGSLISQCLPKFVGISVIMNFKNCCIFKHWDHAGHKCLRTV